MFTLKKKVEEHNHVILEENGGCYQSKVTDHSFLGSKVDL